VQLEEAIADADMPKTMLADAIKQLERRYRIEGG
jgi:hypothetical protein